VHVHLHELDLEEWPLMFAISVVVAVAADRVASTSRRYAALYQRASDRLITAQEDERRKLALDLHDGVGQTLAALVYTLDASESTLWAGPNPPSPLARSAIRRAQDLAAIALEDTRDVAYRLRPARFVEIGLLAGIEQLAKAMGARFHLDVDPDLVRPGLLDPQAEIDVYRVVQEALANAVRHSHAKLISVTVSSPDGRLWISVRDNGVGFRGAPRPTGLGVAGMHERAHVIDGELRIDSRPGVGTTVTLAVPIPVAIVGDVPAALVTSGAEMSR
jgi:signal transduction histidine kinase